MPIGIWTTVMPILVFNLAQPESQPPTADAPATTATGFLYKTITFNGETYAYCVYVPPDYTPQRRWPVILFLHGSGERGSDGFLQTDVGIGRAIRRGYQRIPAIVVMPQCRPNMAWTGPMAALALRCVEETSRTYRLDPQRVYLTGLSLGGQGTWLLGAEFADRFAALVPICGFAELGESSGLAEKLAARLTDIPIWCFHGDADPAVPVRKSRELVEAIRRAGGQIKYTEYAGARHNVWDRAYGDPQLWEWLFAQKREPRATRQP